MGYKKGSTSQIDVSLRGCLNFSLMMPFSICYLVRAVNSSVSKSDSGGSGTFTPHYYNLIYSSQVIFGDLIFFSDDFDSNLGDPSSDVFLIAKDAKLV